MNLLAFTLVLCLCATTFVTEAQKPLPSVYIQMEFSLTWSEFCLLETYFKTKLSEIVIQNDGQQISPSRIYLHNFDENCPVKDNAKEVKLTFYVVKPGGTYLDVDADMTKHAYKVLHYLVENNIVALFGNVFQKKIEKVEIAGQEAPTSSNDFTELERTYIALGIAVGVITIFLLVIITVYFIKQRLNPDQGESDHKPGYTEENPGALELVESAPPQHVNQQPHAYEHIVDTPPPPINQQPNDYQHLVDNPPPHADEKPHEYEYMVTPPPPHVYDNPAQAYDNPEEITRF